MEETFSDWLRRSLDRRGWTQGQLSIKVGVSPATVSRWLSGGRPDPEYAGRLAKAFEEPLQRVYALAGHPSEYVPPERQPLTPREQILEALDELPIEIPVYEQLVSAGEGQGVILDRLYLPPRFTNSRKLFGLMVRGDSMAPDILDGDTLVVDPELTPRDGDTVVGSVDGEVYVKTLRAVNGELVLVSASGRRVSGGLDALAGVVILEPGPHFDLVRQAYELAAAGVSSREITRRLNAALAPRTLHLSTVRKIIHNPAYAGRVVWDSVDVQALWPPLVDPDLCARAQAQQVRRYRERAPLSQLYPFWVVGLAYCRCGARMHPKISVKTWGTKYAYLVCGKQDTPDLRRGCHGAHYPIDPVQDAVLDLVSGYRIADIDTYIERLAARQRAAGDEAERRLASLRSERERLASRVQKAKAGYLDNVLSAADVRQVETAVRDNIAAIDRELSQPPVLSDVDVDDVRRFLAGDFLVLRHDDPAAFRAWLQRFISRVEVWGRGDYRIVWRDALIPA